MIHDKLVDLEKYKGLHPNIKEAIEYILDCDMKNLPMGKNIVNDKLFYIHSKMYGKQETDLDFEFHKKYADIQIVIDGAEYIEQVPHYEVNDNEVITPYDEELDKGYVRIKHYNKLLMNKDVFTLILPLEYHKSELRFDDNESEKVTWKVLID